MRIHSIKLAGLIPFPHEVSLDLDALEGQLVAVCGENGAGKSTLMEAMAGSFYRKCPTRGSLVSLSRARDAFVETRITNGKPWTIHHDMDAVSGKSESAVQGADGREVLENRLVRSFDAWGARTLPPPSVLYASTFAAQGSGGFLALPPTERKGVLLRVQGVERLERLAELAREHARESKAAIAVLDARLAEIQQGGAIDVAAATEACEKARAALVADESRRAAATLVLEAARAEAANARLHNEASQKRMSARAMAASARTSIEQRRNYLVSRILDLRMSLEGADAAKAAATRVAELNEQLALLDGEAKTAEAALRSSIHAVGEATNREGPTLARHAELARARLADNAKLIAERGRLLLLASDLPNLEKVVARAEASLSEWQERLRELNSRAVLDAGARVVALRNVLEEISSESRLALFVQDLGVIAELGIQADDRAASDAAEIPRLIDTATLAQSIAKRDLHEARTAVENARANAARAAGMQPAVGLEEALAEALAAQAIHVQSTADAKTTTDRLTGELMALRTRRDVLRAEREALSPEADRAASMASTAALLVELDTQMVATERELAAATAALADADREPIPDFRPIPDLPPLEVKARDAERWYAAARAAWTTATTAVDSARAAAERVAAVKSARSAAAEDLADWSRLATDLGRDGLQAVLIDAVAPELTTLTNDLLHSCVGPRWTVTIAMNRPGGAKEECSIRIIDTERGSDVDAEVLSGGESVIVGEAIGLALSCLACRNWGVERPTLIRDESGAALSPENTRAYAAMLRRAAGFVGAAQTLIVTHSPELAAMCDSIVRVHDGQITVEAA